MKPSAEIVGSAVEFTLLAIQLTKKLIDAMLLFLKDESVDEGTAQSLRLTKLEYALQKVF